MDKNAPVKYKLRILDGKVVQYANAYPAGADERIAPHAEAAKRRGYLAVEELYEICRWKSKRRANLAWANDVAAVKGTHSVCFNGKN